MRLVGVQNVRSRLCVLLIASPTMSTNSHNSDCMLRPKAQFPRDSESIPRVCKLLLHKCRQYTTHIANAAETWIHPLGCFSYQRNASRISVTPHFRWPQKWFFRKLKKVTWVTNWLKWYSTLDSVHHIYFFVFTSYLQYLSILSMQKTSKTCIFSYEVTTNI